MHDEFVKIDHEENEIQKNKKNVLLAKMTKLQKFFAAFKSKLLGRNIADGYLFKFVIYVLLIAIGFIYVYPILYMISRSFMSRDDLINPTILWMPTSFYFDNYVTAYRALNYWPTILGSFTINLIPAILQTLVTSLVGYGFAKYQFKFKKLLLALVLLTFIVPAQIYAIPKFQMFNSLELLENPLTIILPALFGQGLNSAIFILIFYQFFSSVPKALDEAAEIEGAGEISLFWRINVPLAGPAYLTTFLFSFVWYWNETYNAGLFLGDSVPTLQLRLGNFIAAFTSEEAAQLNEGIRLAATLLIIIPMLVMYFALQRYFIEGVEKSGIAGGE